MSMTLRENTMAILRYQKYERMPIVHFGFWEETIEKWMAEGHIPPQPTELLDGSAAESAVAKALGFDFNWCSCLENKTGLFPAFERTVIETTAEGYRKVLSDEGVVVLEKEGITSIPTEIDHLLKDRSTWEENFKWRLQYSDDRLDVDKLRVLRETHGREIPIGLHCGSLFGTIRNLLGLEGASYLYCDDEGLYDEIINTFGNLSYKLVAQSLKSGAKFDFAHFWEDICFKNGPLVIPNVFREKVAPHYQRITGLLLKNGVDIISLDCDGMIDSLIPIWLDSGINIMFPIEVGTWNANIGCWRRCYGRELRGVGGMNKNVFSLDHSAIDREIERLKPLVQLGGYIPCPDHRIAPDATWGNVQYYCRKMRETF